MGEALQRNKHAVGQLVISFEAIKRLETRKAIEVEKSARSVHAEIMAKIGLENQRQVPEISGRSRDKGGNITHYKTRRAIFVIDVAEGDKIPRKGGPGICNSDLLVINKIDLAQYVGADLEVMKRDATKMRGERPFLLVSIRHKEGLNEIVEWVKAQLPSHVTTS